MELGAAGVVENDFRQGEPADVGGVGVHVQPEHDVQPVPLLTPFQGTH